jgi:hypothetical protein
VGEVERCARLGRLVQAEPREADFPFSRNSILVSNSIPELNFDEL